MYLGEFSSHQAIYSLLMLNNDFLAESANIKELVPEAEGLNILRSRHDGRRISHTPITEITAEIISTRYCPPRRQAHLAGPNRRDRPEIITRYCPCAHACSYRRSVDRCMSNSFGFGGTNACLIFDRFSD